MSLRFHPTLSNIFLTALLVLLTWTSLAQGAAINRNILPAMRDLGGEVGASGVDVSNYDILRRDDITLTTNPEGETLVRRDRDGAGGSVEDWDTLVARTTEEKDEELPVDSNRDLQRRWYTLVEIAESEEESE